MNKGGLVQFGLPEQIHHEPSSLFVAQFTGTLGSLETTVNGSVLTCGEVKIELPGPHPVQGQVRLALRPEALTVQRAHAAGLLEAIVVHSAYRRSHYQCWLRLQGEQRMLVHVNERLPSFERVWVRLDPFRLFVFPDEGQETIETASTPPAFAGQQASEGR